MINVHTTIMSVLLLFGALLFVKIAFYLIIRERRATPPINRGICDLPNIALIIPAFQEQGCIIDTLTHLLTLSYPPDRLKIVVVTTAAEDQIESSESYIPTTATLVDSFIDKLKCQHNNSIFRIHYPYCSGWMAHQINYGVRYLFEAYDCELNPDLTLIGILNADSRPEVNILHDAVRSIGYDRVVHQATTIYSLRSWDSIVDRLILGGSAIWQTRWSVGVEYWRSAISSIILRNRYRGRVAEIFKNIILPYNYVVGHGVFIRLRDFIEVNYFPEFTPNEDAALGYLLPFYNIPVKGGTVSDIADVPSRITTLIRQQGSWIIGPLNSFEYGKYARTSQLEQSIFITMFNSIKAWWDALVWIIGPFIYSIIILTYFTTRQTPENLAFFGFTIYIILPSLPLIVLSNKIFPNSKYPYLEAALATLFIPVFYIIHGIGGLYGLSKWISYIKHPELFCKHKTTRNSNGEI